MKNISKYWLLLSLLACVSIAEAQTFLGYSNGTVARKAGVRFGTGDIQGMAIRIPKEKSIKLQGKEIVGVQSAFGTSQIKNLKVFISKNLNEKPLYEEVVSGPTTSWKEFPLSTPYIVDGEEFFVGYIFEVASTYKPLLFDGSSDFGGQYFWAYNDGEWIDVSNKGYGAANIRVNVEDAPRFVDLMIKPISADGFYKEGNAYDFEGQIFNFGTETIQSFDISCQIGNGIPTVYSIDQVNVECGSSYHFTLPEYVAEESGKLPFKVEVNNLNNNHSLDIDVKDNVSNQMTYVYPSWVEKKVLIENFTGQSCGNCPSGHQSIDHAIASFDDAFVHVSHHSGYTPDAFTTVHDVNYTWLYNSSSLYAPACMFNRMPFEDGLTSVVFIPMETKNLDAAIKKSLNVPPYVGITLSNSFDKSSMQGVLSVDVHTFVHPSNSPHRLNIFLTQDNIVAYQSNGGADYIHQHVFRDALTGTWGEPIQLVEGETITQTFSYKIPETIESTYYSEIGENPVFIPTEIDNMNWVVFVSEVSDSPLECKVFNTVSQKVSENLNLSIGDDGLVYEKPYTVNHQRLILNHPNVKSCSIYNLQGSLLDALNGFGDSCLLNNGVYLLKFSWNDGHVTSAKIVIADE